MFEKKVVVTDEALIVGQTRILWENIAGIREQDDPILRKISKRFPRSEIFLKDGKVVTISNLNKLQNQSSFVKDDDGDFFQFLMRVISKKAPEAVSQSKAWFEWRLLLPVVIIEIFILLGCISAKRSFEETTLFVIFGGILGAMAGWVWEKQTRKKRYS